MVKQASSAFDFKPQSSTNQGNKYWLEKQSRGHHDDQQKIIILTDSIVVHLNQKNYGLSLQNL